MELLLKTPLTNEVARIHLQRAWYVALGSAAVMLLGGLVWTSLNLLLGAVILVGLGHGMISRSWVSAGALLLYLTVMLLQAGWSQRQPLLVILALAVGYFLAQGFRAAWWWWDQEDGSRPDVTGPASPPPGPGPS